MGRARHDSPPALVDLEVPGPIRAPFVEDWIDDGDEVVRRTHDGTVDLEHRATVALGAWLRWHRARRAWAIGRHIAPADLRRLSPIRSPRWRHPLTDDDPIGDQEVDTDARP